MRTFRAAVAAMRAAGCRLQQHAKAHQTSAACANSLHPCSPPSLQHFERYFGADVEGWACPAEALNVAADGCEQAGKDGSRFWLRLDLVCPHSNEAAKVEALVAVLPGGKIEVGRCSC